MKSRKSVYNCEISLNKSLVAMNIYENESCICLNEGRCKKKYINKFGEISQLRGGVQKN